jgi:glycerol-3-phosphate dehydrogenase
VQRDLSRLSNEQFDLLVIGGGATGAFAARDAAMRGLKVALIEKGDFASATSAHNSKLVHGGLRYLRNGEFGLVRESLRERRILQAIAPHLVRPLSFLLPLYDKGVLEKLTLATGLTLYDLLAYDRNRLEDPDLHLPSHRWLGRDKALAAEPVLAGDGFKGAFSYPDAQMFMPERIALENLIDADAHGAALANHVGAEKLILREGRVIGVEAADVFGGARLEIRSRTVLLALGPWSDLFLEKSLGRPATHKLVRSKGIHLLVPALTEGHALTLEAGAGHFFVMPWRGHTLIGTTDTEFRDDPGSVAVRESDIGDFLAVINRYLPSAKLRRDEVLFAYAGLRPLVADGKNGTYGVSRRAELVDHSQEGMDGLFSALGGKWTTSRALAQTTIDAVAAKLGNTVPCTTATTPLPGGRMDRFEGLVKGFAKTYPGIAAMRHLAHMYGARLPLLLRGAKLTDLAPMNVSGDVPAQVAFSIREEMALTLEDLVMRRTAIGQFGKPAPELLARLAAMMGAELGWSPARQQSEIDAVNRLYEIAA